MKRINYIKDIDLQTFKTNASQDEERLYSGLMKVDPNWSDSGDGGQ